jgi:GAF domain-containing protein
MSSENKSQPTIKGFFHKLIKAHPSIQGAGIRRNAELSSAISLAMVVITLAATVLTYHERRYIQDIVNGLVGLSGISFIAYLLSRSRFPNVGAILLTISPAMAGFWLTISSGQSIYFSLFFTIPLSMIVGSILLPVWAEFILVVVNITATALVTYAAPEFPSLNAYILATNFSILGSALLIVMVARNILEHQRIGEIVEANRKLQLLQATLEQRVEERTRQVRIAADIARNITASLDLDALLIKTVNLIIERFGYYHAGIFLIDDTGRYAVLRAAQGPSAEQILAKIHRLAVGSPSIIGWVTANKQPRLVSNVVEDPIHLKNELLPETQAEVAVPIIAGNQVLGALDVQSTNINAFDVETIETLQILANQIASAIQNVHLLESNQLGNQDVADIYRIGSQIARAQTENEVYQKIQDIFSKTPYLSFYLVAAGDDFRIVVKSGLKAQEGLPLPESITITTSDLESCFSTGIFIGEEARMDSLPSSIVKLLQQFRIYSVALVPVMRNGAISALFIIGTREKSPLAITNMQPYVNIAEVTAIALDRILETRNTERRVVELEAITLASQEISSLRDLPAIYSTLHAHIRQTLGDVNFLVALYDAGTDSISIPYMLEKSIDGSEITQIETFPLGEGLTSILIRTKQPLMIVEDTERRAAALGAKVVGKTAKSWLGVPLLTSGDVIGAIIVQDTEHELAFDDGDMHFLTTLAAQIAGAIHNTRLLEETRGRALQLQTAAEIARDISSSLDLGELLSEAVTLIRERFNFYHAVVFLIDPANEFAVIREATGEAGLQMKRAGHKLKIGSKSIVGYVTGSGEPLVVNDTSRDATYYANPLLPETRAEVAIPLKVGARILGALDVQSSQPYSFSKEDISVLRILADQLAVAVINSELFAETQEHLSQHRLLHHVTTAAASGTTLEEALNSAAQGLQVTLGGDRVAILLADKDKKILTVKAIAGYSEEVKQVEVPFGEGITGWVAEHQQLQRINDVMQDARYIEVGSNVRSELAIPLSYRGELLGVLNVESDQTGAYSENDEELLGTLGGSLAAIMANARLLEQIRRQADSERLLYEVTSKIRRSTDMQTIMATTTSELSKALGAHRAQIKFNTGNDKNTSSGPSGKETK